LEIEIIYNCASNTIDCSLVFQGHLLFIIATHLNYTLIFPEDLSEISSANQAQRIRLSESGFEIEYIKEILQERKLWTHTVSETAPTEILL
jgi:hypothetical protein